MHAEYLAMQGIGNHGTVNQKYSMPSTQRVNTGEVKDHGDFS